MYIFDNYFFSQGLLSEDQCKARDARRKAKQKYVPKKEAHSPDSYEHSSDIDTIFLESHLETKNPFLSFSSNVSTSSGIGSPCSPLDEYCDPMKKLTPEHRELVETLVALQDKYEFADQQSYEETLVRNISYYSFQELGCSSSSVLSEADSDYEFPIFSLIR